ncbi:OsmC-like protein [Dendrothele bispora CBS 962.96]|uniref:OsmC-like protein n=1 Tax=Dendrothele bispora (strain CBS 962.96) TaxID=1314807 RepID=A0A4S8LXK2_DENBC|nr:OsmC-like protein [Dendrothele bispora CBS 962.96]
MFAARSVVKTSPLRFLRSSISKPIRTVVTVKNVEYTARATAEGAGWNGDVYCEGQSVKLALPKVMGGTGLGQNPEQLFAMGYSACLLGSIQYIAKKQGKSELAKDAKVHASVSIGEAEGVSGWGIKVDVEVEGLKDESLLKAGSEFCPYSRILKDGAVVTAKCI